MTQLETVLNILKRLQLEVYDLDRERNYLKFENNINGEEPICILFNNNEEITDIFITKRTCKKS